MDITNQPDDYTQLCMIKPSHRAVVCSSTNQILITTELMLEALSRLFIQGSRTRFTVSVDMGRVVGYQRCLPLFFGDKVVWARCQQEPKRLVRLLFNAEPIATTKITVHLRSINASTYLVERAYEGEYYPLFPRDKSPGKECIDFWENHALTIDPLNPIIEIVDTVVVNSRLKIIPRRKHVDLHRTERSGSYAW